MLQALRRELHEETRHFVQRAEAWRTEVVDYPHALVRLNFCKVSGWLGALQMREGQSFRWQQLPVEVGPVLPGTIPVLRVAGARSVDFRAPRTLIRRP